MNLYNTRTQRVDPFRFQNDPITIYTCGITPYDTTHIGHAFTYSTVDVLIRFLESQGHPVNYVQNVTDIDDDILRKAQETGRDWQELGTACTADFIHDMQSLNIRAPEHFPRASEMITPIIAMIETLLAKQMAYVSEGSVYFSIDRWPAYGDLSRLPGNKMLTIANERGNNPTDPDKHAPLDFVLWQKQAPGEPAWPSPWGAGRPGWHIECSAMAHHFLGDQIDLHAGGADLIFPHHESEVAQSEAATGRRPFVQHWLHVAMVEYEGQKMSKSLGNLVFVRDLLGRYSPDAVRLHLIKHHYRQSWSYSEVEMGESARQLDLLLYALTRFGGHGESLEVESSSVAFSQALADDLNTPQALHILFQMAEQITNAAQRGSQVNDAQSLLQGLAAVVGLRLDAEATESQVMADWNRHLLHIENPD